MIELLARLVASVEATAVVISSVVGEQRRDWQSRGHGGFAE